MSFVPRAILPSRIGGQMAILIVASLAVIHALITASIFLSIREGWRPGPFGGAGELTSLTELIAATPPAQRARLIDDLNKAFTGVRLQAIAVLPPRALGLADARHVAELTHALGPRFTVVPVAHTAPGDGGPASIAIGLPDGEVLEARLMPRQSPPLLGGPLTTTALFVVISLTLLGIWAARALTRPLSEFATAAEVFNLDGAIAPLPERGPDEIRAVARALNGMRRRIKSLVEDRTRMLAAVGHDLRTPITRLRLRVEFIADAAVKAQMLRDLEQMQAMIDGVLAFLRDGRAGETVAAVDVATTLATICDEYSDLGHDVRYVGPPHAVITAQAEALSRAVGNLVDNAVRHASKVSVVLTQGDADTRIAVADDGPGIPDAEKTAMLEPFVRGDAARGMNEAAGFGLGLAIAKAVAVAHGGTLTLTDAEPHGLVATIVLPPSSRDPGPAARAGP